MPLRQRIPSIDVARGAAMILMAIDHVRVFAGVPPGGPRPGVFFTRWITNFVAPAFAFLSGTSAYLLGQKLGDRRALSKYLVTRGLILVVLELTVIRVAWTFNLDFGHYLLAGVIWMLGWCMVLLAALVWLPVMGVAAFGVGVIFLHNLMDFLSPAATEAFARSSFAWLWQILYFGGPLVLGEKGPTLAVLYSIFPWVGVMAAGYAFGAVITLEPKRRDRICITIGASAIVLFLLLRTIDAYGDPRHWREGPPGIPTLFRFINTTKYPASLDFLLMTLGPTILLLPLAERARGKIGEIVATFGRVPMFYYLMHIPTIHIAAVFIALAREGKINPWLFANHPMMAPPPPDGYTWPLWLLYLVFI
ncbi:MAG: heparan-alpha-glucosaminide N-acetyltransferase domain-containing protein, partial [Gemmatimonadales bacterium]